MITPTRPTPEPAKQFALAKISEAAGYRILIYGTGGIGKTTLACQLPGRTAFVDSDESLPTLKRQLLAQCSELPVIVPCNDFQSLREFIKAPGLFEKIDNIVIDSVTKIEEWAVADTLARVRCGDGTKPAKSIEDYGYGKGYQHVFDTFNSLLADLERHHRAGRNVVFIAHECTANVPNPMDGGDWLRYEPRLQSPNSGKASIRLRLKEWCDHVLFMAYDVAVEKKRAQGGGTKTIYCSELPFCMAKSRTTSGSLPVNDGKDFWSEIIKK